MIIDSGIVTGSLQVSGSFSVQGNTILAGGLDVVGGITGSISGSSATAVSASHADNADQAITASYASTSLNWLSSSFYVPYTGSTTDVRLGLNDLYADNIISTYPGFGVLAALTRDVSGTGYGILNLKYGISNGFLKPTTLSSDKNWTLPDKSGTVALLSDTFPYTGSAIVSGSLEVIGSLDATVVSASYIQALSASIEYLSVIYQTSSVVYSSGSNQLGDSPADTQTLYGTVDIKNGPVLVTGSLNVSNTATATSGSFGYLFADYAKTELLYVSGNTQLGNNPSDYQAFFGTIDIINGPVLVTGSLNVANRITAGELTVLYSITGSLNGTASYADAASTASLALLALSANTASFVQQAQNAFTASYVNLAQTASFVETAQFAITASYVNLAQTASYVAYAENAFTASYVDLAQSASYVAIAVSASRAISAANADTASYVVNAISSSYSIYTVSASHAIQADLATTASYILSAVTASYAVNATNAATASSAEDFTVRGLMGVGGPTNAFHQMYVTTSISDGTLGLDSSGEVNALYFLKGGIRGFEISTAVSSSHVTQLLPYTSSGFFQIGNPSNASNDLIFLSEPVDGNVLLGPGILTGSTSLSGSQPTDRVQFTGDTFVSGALTILGNQYSQGTVTSTGFIGNLTGIADTAISAPYYVLTASYNADSASVSTRTTNLESTASTLTNASASFVANYINNSQTSSMTVLSASFASTASYALNINPAATASYALQALNADTASYVLNAVSASYATITDTAISAPYYVLTASYQADSASVSTRTTNLEATASELTIASASIVTQLNTISGVTASYATTGSNTFTGSTYISDTTNATSFTSTAALYTDGGMRVAKDTYVSGGLYVAGDFTVYGTASVSYVTTSVFVGLEYINLNTELPGLRYAGINVGDSGSSVGISSSYWYDSEKDNWIYVYANPGSADQTSSLAINGPITYNNVGNEQGLLANYITKGQLVTPDNNHHITSSQIYDDGTTVAIAGNLQVTGSLYAGNLTGSLNGSNLVVGSVGNDRLTNSAITIAGVSTSLGGSITAATILDGTGVFSGSAQIPNTSITNAQLANSAVTVTAGTGLSGGGSVALGSTVTLTNAGVTSNVAGSGISVSGATGAVTITNTGVTSNVAGTGVTVSGATGAVTISIGQAVGTASNVQFNSLGVGTAGSAVAGEIRATADVTAFYSSDERLKENITPIENPIEKLMAIKGVTFDWKEGFEEFHSHVGADTGVIAQDIEAIELPGTVTTRETGYKAVKYEKLNALLIEVVKLQQTELNTLKLEFAELKAKLK